MAEGSEINDDDWLSQRVYVDDDDKLQAWNRPRPQDRGELSAFHGLLTAEEAYRKVVGLLRRRTPPDSDVDGVRHAQVGDLRAAGFVVKSAPTSRNPDHLLISCESAWDDFVATKFDRCFGEIVWHDGGGRTT